MTTGNEQREESAVGESVEHRTVTSPSADSAAGGDEQRPLGDRQQQPADVLQRQAEPSRPPEGQQPSSTAPQQDEPRKRLTKIRSLLPSLTPGWTERAILGFWLVALYVVLITFVVFSFSAYQFHLAVRQATTSDNQSISLGEIVDLRERWRSIQDRMAYLYDELYIANGIAARNNSNLMDGYIARNKVYDDCKHEVEAVFAKHDRSNFDFLLIKCNKSDADLSKNLTSDEEKKNALAIVARYEPQIKIIEQDIAFATAERKAALEDAVSIDKEIDRKIADKRTFLEKSKLKGVSDFIGGADFFDPSRLGFAGLVPNFLIMPTDTLVLIIVISMGALGGAIQITRNFLSPEDLTNIDTYRIRYRYIFFQPFLGAITALAIFILFKAGVMVASSNLGSSQDPGLNPFFISFLGIISGLMANIALNSIIKVGENWFRSAGEGAPARWAVGLKELMAEEATKSFKGDVEAVKKTILEYIDVDNATLGKWIDQTDPVPADFQKTLAVFFRKKQWQMFTDLPLKLNSGAR